MSTVPSHTVFGPAASLVLALLLVLGCESTADLGGSCDCDASCPPDIADAAETGNDASIDASDAGSDATPEAGQDAEPDADAGGADASDAAGDASTQRFYVFITRATYVANFGSIAEGDFRCQTSAAAAGRSGTWKAWLSDEVTDAADRFTAEGPRYEVESEKLLFPNLAGLRGYPISPIYNDELGDEAPDRWWTGTLSNGVKSEKHCLNWTADSQYQGGMTGHRLSPVATPGPEWTEDESYACVGSFALLCIQDG